MLHKLINFSKANSLSHIPSALSMLDYIDILFTGKYIIPFKDKIVLGKPFGSQAYYLIWKACGYLDDIELQAKRVAAFSAAAATAPASIVASYVIPDLTQAQLENRRESGQLYGSGNNGIVIQIDGKNVVDAVVGQAMSGNNAYLNRRLGGFD